MIRLFANTNYDFIKWRKFAFALTGVIMLVACRRLKCTSPVK